MNAKKLAFGVRLRRFNRCAAYDAGTLLWANFLPIRFGFGLPLPYLCPYVREQELDSRRTTQEFPAKEVTESRNELSQSAKNASKPIMSVRRSHSN